MYHIIYIYIFSVPKKIDDIYLGIVQTNPKNPPNIP